jgi:hypothetical protein
LTERRAVFLSIRLVKLAILARGQKGRQTILFGYGFGVKTNPVRVTKGKQEICF